MKKSQLYIKNKYQSLYSSVPTSDTELAELKKMITNGIITEGQQNIVMTPAIVAQCISQLKRGKDDGNHVFKSDHGYNAKNVHISSIL